MHMFAKTFSAVVLMICVNGVGITTANATVISLFTDSVAFQASLASFGLTSQTIDFETQPNGAAVPAGDLAAASPLNYSIFGGQNTASFSTASSFVFENFVSISPSHSLRETNSGPTSLAYTNPVAAIGTFLLDIDKLVIDAATAVYSSTSLPNVQQTFDNSGGSQNVNRFFGAIATNNAGTAAENILTGATFDLSNVGGGAEFTYLEDVTTGVAAAPEPSTLALLGLGLIGVGFASRSRLQ